MVDPKKIPSLHYYNLGDTYTGASEGMRYRIALKKTEDGKLLEGTVWPEPYCYDKTAEARRTAQTFDYAEEGLEACIAWLQEQDETRREEWKNAPSVCSVAANW